MKSRYFRSYLLIFGTVCAVAAGCGRSASTGSFHAGYAVTEEASEAAYDTADGSADDTYGIYGKSSDDSSSDSSSDNNQTTTAADSAQKLVYTSSVSIDTKEYDKTKAEIRQRIEEDQAIISEETEQNNDTYWYESYGGDGLMQWDITIRIPPDKYQAFIDSLENGESSRVMSISSSVRNISTEYHDKQTEIQALETEEERLLAMMDQATTIDEMIQVEKRLTEVQTTLNQSKTDLAAMDTDVNYSTITISLYEVRSYRDPVPEEPDTFGERFIQTCKDSWNKFTGGLEDIFFFIILYLPELLIIILIVLIALRFIKKHHAKKNLPAAERMIKKLRKEQPKTDQKADDKTDDKTDHNS